MKKQNILRLILLIVLISAVTIFFAFDLKQYFTLESIKSQQEALQSFYEQNTIQVLGVYGLIYVTVTALSLPAAAAMTLLAGALFGFITGLILVSFASTIGATLAFLIARFLLRDLVQNRYGSYLKKINEGFEREGAFYLFALRLVPAFPFFLINLVTALLPIKIWTFYWVSQLGMLAGTAVYVYAGTELGRISSFSDITSPGLLIAFTLLGLFPLIARKVLNLIRRKNIPEKVQNK